MARHHNEEEVALPSRQPVIKRVSLLRRFHLELPLPEAGDDMEQKPIMLKTGNLSYA